MDIMNIKQLLNHQRTKYFLAGFTLLSMLVGLYLWRQRISITTSRIKFASPFSGLSYQGADLSGKQIIFTRSSFKLPKIAKVYSKKVLSPPLLLEPEGINKLKETLGIKDTDRTVAPAEAVFWYANDRYLSYNQETNDLSFTLNVRAQERTPPKGSCLSEQEAKNFTRQFLINNKLVDLREILDQQLNASLEEMTVVGLMPASTSTCQVVKVSYQPQLDNSPFLYSGESTFVRVMRVDNQNQIAGLHIHNAQYQETQPELPLKSVSEIKNALQDGQAVYFQPCASKRQESRIKLNPPQLTYFENESIDSVQPIFVIKEEISGTCQTTILVRGLKEAFYEN